MQSVRKLAKAHLSLPQKDPLSMDVYGVAQILDQLNTIFLICDETFLGAYPANYIKYCLIHCFIILN